MDNETIEGYARYKLEKAKETTAEIIFKEIQKIRKDCDYDDEYEPKQIT